MKVQTVKYNTAYKDNVVTVCAECAQHIKDSQDDNAMYNHYCYTFEALGDWHEGICERHDYISPAGILHKCYG